MLYSLSPMGPAPNLLIMYFVYCLQNTLMCEQNILLWALIGNVNRLIRLIRLVTFGCLEVAQWKCSRLYMMIYSLSKNLLLQFSILCYPFSVYKSKHDKKVLQYFFAQVMLYSLSPMGPAPQTRTLLPRETPALLQACTPTHQLGWSRKWFFLLTRNS